MQWWDRMHAVVEVWRCLKYYQLGNQFYDICILQVIEAGVSWIVARGEYRGEQEVNVT